MAFFVDVHTHLTHDDFNVDRDQVIARARAAGLGAIVVNGLEPISNRMILAMAKADTLIKPALGIYPLDAVCQIIPKDFPFEVRKFDVFAEIAFIRSEALAGRLAAIGECGLDGYYLGPEYLPGQEKCSKHLLA